MSDANPVESSDGLSATYLRTGAVATIELNRATKGNSIDLLMAAAIRAAVVLAEKDVHKELVRVVVLRAKGPRFCLGGDLIDFRAAPDPGTHIALMAAEVHDAISRLQSLEAPVISYVTGTVAGGGVGIALSADVILVTSNVSFHSGYAGIGLSPDCGTSWAVTSALGSARAFDFLLADRPITAVEAAERGLVSRICEPDEGETALSEIVDTLLKLSLPAIAATKRLVRQAPATTFGDQLENEKKSISVLAAGADSREGIAAFLEKRPPVYTHRAAQKGESIP